MEQSEHHLESICKICNTHSVYIWYFLHFSAHLFCILFIYSIIFPITYCSIGRSKHVFFKSGPLGEGFCAFRPQIRILHAKILPWNTSWAHMAWFWRYWKISDSINSSSSVVFSYFRALGEGFDTFRPQIRILHAKILPWDTSWAHMARF